ncbi:MAG TPA: hypothetical protein VG675_15335 [Bryobacteraceae bacterium]|nr:hypothetical protein [Bryobacteraceae bacterium]
MPRSRLSCLFSLALCCSGSLIAQISVLTYQYDNTRAGANFNEAILTKSNVNANQFGKLFSYPVDGYLYGQPLYVPSVNIPGKGMHNVVYVATEHDSVYAFDADSNAGPNSEPLWHVSFINPGAGITTVPYGDTGCSQIVPEIGISGTPVIDLKSGTIYMVAMTKEAAGGLFNYVHRLHALDISTGAEKPGSPVVIQATYSGTGEGSTTLVFNPKNYKQRPGLLLLNGTVYTTWSSHCDIGRYHGWLMGYDATTLQQTAVYNNTPDGNEGSFWTGGAAPAVDQAGEIYLVAGNGTFDYANGGTDLGESYIKLAGSGGLAVDDYFTPFNFNDLNQRDVDVGSAGVALLGDEAGSPAHPHLMVGAGKEGRVYLLDRDNMGKWQSGSDSQIVQSLPLSIGGLFGNPAYFNKSIYLCGAGDNLKAFSVVNAHMSTNPTSRSPEAFDFPGCLPTISANGAANGIAWILEGSGTLHAYDASNLGNELYHSNQNANRDALGAYVKFTVPMVANGKVYAGSQSALNVYGELPPVATVGVTNAASGSQNAAAPGGIISIFGAGLAQGTASASTFPLPKSLAGSSVTVNGTTAPLYYASPTQVNAQIPFEAAPGAANISVISGGAVVASANVLIGSVGPGIFTLAPGRAAALNQDYSVNGPDRPAAPGSAVLIYLTSLGAVDHPVATGAAAGSNPLSRVVSQVTASIGGADATVLFSGLAPGFAGLYQVNLLVPQMPPGEYPVQISTGGAVSNVASVSIQ